MKPLLRDVLICIQRDLEIRAEVKPKTSFARLEAGQDVEMSHRAF